MNSVPQQDLPQIGFRELFFGSRLVGCLTFGIYALVLLGALAAMYFTDLGISCVSKFSLYRYNLLVSQFLFYALGAFSVTCAITSFLKMKVGMGIAAIAVFVFFAYPVEGSLQQPPILGFAPTWARASLCPMSAITALQQSIGYLFSVSGLPLLVWMTIGSVRYRRAN